MKPLISAGDASFHYLQVTNQHSIDVRGELTSWDFRESLPFTPVRFFNIRGVPDSSTRGGHAHRACLQFLICLQGSVVCTLDDGRNSFEFLLDSPTKGLFIPRLVWGTQAKFEAGTVLGVFASHQYDEGDYIRSYPEFRKLTLEGFHEK